MASKVAGQAKAVISVLNTVIMAPCFINASAIATANSISVSVITRSALLHKISTSNGIHSSATEITGSEPILDRSTDSNQMLGFPD